MTPDKGVHTAVRAAPAAGVPLVVAGKCTERHERRYEERIARSRVRVEWIGQADTTLKKRLLCDVRCLVFPIDWEEPFGIVMVEAMASGTSAVSLARCSMPEVVAHGVTGIVCPGEPDWRALPTRSPCSTRMRAGRTRRNAPTPESWSRVTKRVFARVAAR